MYREPYAWYSAMTLREDLDFAERNWQWPQLHIYIYITMVFNYAPLIYPVASDVTRFGEVLYSYCHIGLITLTEYINE